LAPLALPAGTTADITASVTVVKTCGIDVDTSSITFTKSGGDLAPGDTSDTVSRNVKNTGSSGQTECRYEISGTDWSGPDTMQSEQTDYKCTDAAGIDCNADGFTDLTNSGVDFLGLDAGKTASVDFQVAIPDNQLSGSYSQTITVTLV